jgi:hypothetical protein
MKTNLLEILIVVLLGFIAYNLWSGQNLDPAPAVAQPVIVVQPAQQQPAAQSSVPVNVGDQSQPAQQPAPAPAGTSTPGPTLNEVMGLPDGGNPFTGETP